MPRTPDSANWPRKLDLLGVHVSATDYDEAVECIVGAARGGRRAIVSLHAVHAVVTVSSDLRLRRMVNTFDMIGADGQPVRWALNLLHGAGLRERVYGPELMLRVCERSAAERLPIFLYGGTPPLLAALAKRLRQRFASLEIAGSFAPPFRPLTPAERAEVLERIRASGARIVFIGLGAPKQDQFAFEHRDQIEAVQVCVGAAFDFHAGVKPMAPRWMQRRGLEWLFRLACEPRRLARRYLVTNTVFVARVSRALLSRALLSRALLSRRRRGPGPDGPPPAGGPHARGAARGASGRPAVTENLDGK